MKARQSPSSKSKLAVSKQVKAPKGSKAAKKQLEGLKTVNEQEQAAKEEVKLYSSKRFGDLLSTEIWILIFELLYSISEKASFSKLRFISRKFDEIVTPIIFRRFELLRGLTAARPNAIRSGILLNIRAHTRHFVLNQYSNQRGVAKFLLQCRSLRDLYCKIDNQGSPLPIDIHNALIHDLPHIQLHLDCSGHSPNGPIQIFEEISSSVTCQSLVSFATPRGCISDSDSLHCAALVVASKNLRVLDVLDCKPFETGDQKLPAIQQLAIAIDSRLHENSFNRPNVQMPKIWDFSNLNHLKIGYGYGGNLQKLEKFLSIVSDEQPSGIESFSMLSSQPWDRYGIGHCSNQAATEAKVEELLHKIIGTIDRLRELKLAWSFPQRLSLLLPKHENTLRSLGLLVGALGGPPVSSAEMRQIRTSCPYLTDLIIDIDLNRHLGEPEMEFEEDSIHGIGVVKELSHFQHLRRLKLISQKITAQHIMRRLERNQAGTPVANPKNLEESTEDLIVKHVHDLKTGVPLSQLVILFREYPQSTEIRYAWDYNGRATVSRKSRYIFELDDSFSFQRSG